MRLLHGDCLELLPTLSDNSVDLVLADPPYGTTACKWDSVIPLEPMWKELKRVAKKRAAIVLTAGQPFTSALVMSNVKMFRYTWVWDKKVGSNFATVKYMPFKEHEDVCVFYQATPTYNPQRIMRSPESIKRFPVGKINFTRVKEVNRVPRVGGAPAQSHYRSSDGTRYPRTIIEISSGGNSKERGYHPTQKPVALMEYFIKTYTNEGDTVLDFCMGSGSTGVACVNLGRDFIGIEREQEYFDIAQQRISKARRQSNPPLFTDAKLEEAS